MADMQELDRSDSSVEGEAPAKSHTSFATNELVMVHTLGLPEDLLSNHFGIVGDRLFISEQVLEEFESLIIESLRAAEDVPPQFSDPQIRTLIQSCYSDRWKHQELWPGNKQRGRFIALGEVDMMEQSKIPILAGREYQDRFPKDDPELRRKAIADSYMQALGTVEPELFQRAVLSHGGLFFAKEDYEALVERCNEHDIKRRSLRSSIHAIALEGEYYLRVDDKLILGRVLPISRKNEQYQGLRKIAGHPRPAFEYLDVTDPTFQDDRVNIRWIGAHDGGLAKLLKYTADQRIQTYFTEGEPLFTVETPDQVFMVNGHSFGRFMQRSPMTPQTSVGEERPKLTIAPYVRRMAECLTESVEANSESAARRSKLFEKFYRGSQTSIDIRVFEGMAFVIHDRELVKTCLRYDNPRKI